MGSSFIKQFDPIMYEEYIYCLCGNHAVYRCQYINKNINWNNLPPKYGYSMTGDMIQLWCCDKCILESDKNTFTYHPDGWKLAPICHIDYEPSKQPLNYF